MKLVAKTNQCIIHNDIVSDSKAMERVKAQMIEGLKSYPSGSIEMHTRKMTLMEIKENRNYDPEKYQIAFFTKTFVDQNKYCISHDRLVIHQLDEKNGEWQTWTKFGSARCVMVDPLKIQKLKLDLATSCREIDFIEFAQRREEMKHEAGNPIEKR